MITTQIENSGPNITTIASDGADPQHTGSLAVTNAETLAFDPAADPTPHNGTVDVNGGTYVIWEVTMPSRSRLVPRRNSTLQHRAVPHIQVQ